MEKDKKEKKSKEFLYLDDKLTKENARIKFLNEVDESTSQLNKSISRCLNLLSESMKGPEINIMFEEMHDTSETYYKKLSQSLEAELTQSKKEVTTLRKRQDELFHQEERK